MIKRAIQSKIEKYLKAFPVIVLLGPRQVGKTTLAKEIQKGFKKKGSYYFDLEKPSDFDKLDNDAESILGELQKDCVLIDEVQRKPQLFELLRSLVDEYRKPGRFILTGSASPELMKGSSESLAGRVYYFNLNPIGLHEIPSTIKLQKHWFRGGFPTALTSKSNDLSQSWIDSFITTYVERDIAFLYGTNISSITMRKLWGMLAHLHGSILNTEQLGNSLSISATTVKRYIDFLEGAFMIRRLPPYFVNIGKRLVKSPKVYIVDNGILHFLLGIQNEKELILSAMSGPSWEGYVISQIIYAAPNRLDAYYYRTQVGAECDLVLVRGNTVKACVEIKLSKSTSPSKGFYQSVEDLSSTKHFILVNDDVDFLNKNKIRVVGLKSFILKYLPKL